MKLTNLILANREASSRWDVEIDNHLITSVTPHRRLPPNDNQGEEGPPSLLLPSLCHPHIHLDKAYLLTSESNCTTHRQFSCVDEGEDDNNDDDDEGNPPYPSYKDFTPKSGSFTEALSLTSQSKPRYTPKDLRLRGAQLLATSAVQGVTSCRAFVEVDHVTKFTTLEAGVWLKRRFEAEGTMRIQICAFAQDPIISTAHGEENRAILEDALERYVDDGDIEVLGTTPYVETSHSASIQNIEWAITTALKHGLHLDFHLDYNLDDAKPAMIWDVIRLLDQQQWVSRSKAKAITTAATITATKKVTIGHATRLTLFSASELSKLTTAIREAGLQNTIGFVGLPSSDLFMMGRPQEDTTQQQQQQQLMNRPRGTLHIPTLLSDCGLQACMGVNNVGNAFTPWGTGDPLASLATLGVGIYQVGTEKAAEALFWAVSGGARRCIGIENGCDEGEGEKESIREGMRLSFLPRGGEGGRAREGGREGSPLLLIRNDAFIVPSPLASSSKSALQHEPSHDDNPMNDTKTLKVPARHRLSVRDVVWDPPETRLRHIIS